MNSNKIQIDYENTYWNGKGEQQEIAEKVCKLIPTEGECDASFPKLERLRKIVQAYYDLYNNGGRNRSKEIRKYFGSGLKAFNDGDQDPASIKTANEFIIRTEAVVTKAVIEAAKEAAIASAKEAGIL
jgi:hypothetical protein